MKFHDRPSNKAFDRPKQVQYQPLNGPHKRDVVEAVDALRHAVETGRAIVIDNINARQFTDLLHDSECILQGKR